MYCCNNLIEIGATFDVCNQTHTVEIEDCDEVAWFVFVLGSYTHQLPATCDDGIITITGTLPAATILGQFQDEDKNILFDGACYILRATRYVNSCNETESEPTKTFIPC